MASDFFLRFGFCIDHTLIHRFASLFRRFSQNIVVVTLSLYDLERGIDVRAFEFFVGLGINCFGHCLVIHTQRT